MKYCQIFLLFPFLGIYGHLPAATLENNAIRLDADPNSGALSVTLKATGRQWQPGVQPELTATKPLALVDGKITGTLAQKDGTVFGVELSLGKGAEVIVHVLPDASSKTAHDIHYPPAFDAEPNEEIALPHDEGVLLPVTGADEMRQLLQGNLNIYRQNGLSAGFAGVCDPTGKKEGYALMVRTPCDAAFRVAKNNDHLTPQTVWMPSMGAVTYEREMALRFFPKGGYVAIVEAYRAEQLARGNLLTLRDKIKANPKIDRAVGGPQIYLFADGVSLDLIHEMHDAGIDRGFITLPVNNLGEKPVKGETFEQAMKRVAPHIPQGWFEELDRLGYLAAVYQEHTDMSDPAFPSLRMSANYPPQYWPDAGIMGPDGKRKIGYAGKGMRVCTTQGNPVAVQENKVIHALWPAMNSIFIDVDGALEPMECYNPKHPMTRREDIALRGQRLAQPAHDYGWAVATEGGPEWCLPEVFAGQGLLTLVQFRGGMQDAKSPDFDGGWSDEQGRPPAMLKRMAQAPPIYAKYNLGPSYRAPLYELLAHDCILQTWRWDDNSFKIEGYSRRKDLFSILYGTTPMWILDKITWEAHKAEFVKSYHDVCDWQRQIGLEPMTDHGFLTDDRMVQYSIFGNGKTVVVNFAKQPWSRNGITVAAEGFKTFEKAPAWLPKMN